MKKLTLFSFFLLSVLLMGSCSDDSSPSGPDSEPTEASSEKNFVYNAMNYWYYWQGDVPELADDYFESDEDEQAFLNQFSDAEALFDDLQISDDIFSDFIDDYEEYQNERDGVLAALGFEYSFIGFSNTDQLVGYVQYVIPDSPAADAGLKRLDLFTKVDGTQLTRNNVNGLLSNNNSHEFTLADVEDSNQGLSFPEKETVTVASEEVIEDPVYLSTVIDTSNTKIGYMVYNSFRGNSHQALNNSFGDLKSQGIDEFVLDLRYNGGGAVLTSQLLASMISDLGCSDVFAEFEYNEKRSDENETVYFMDEVPLQNEEGDFKAVSREGQCDDFENTEPMNRLGLNHVYVLVTGNTASASEALINSLTPYIDVTMIGLATIGKDEGSLLLVDSPPPYLDEDEANPDHKKAILPIVLKLVNSNGEDYPDGLFPDGFDPAIGQNGSCVDDSNDNCISEITVENIQRRPELGDPADPLLGRAISLITGQQMPKSLAAPRSTIMNEIQVWEHRTNLRPHGKEMYIEPFMMPQKQKK